MKKRLFPFALIALVMCGCARHYVITLTNGAKIDSRGKPQLDGAFFVYKDATGRKVWVSSGRVVEIAPASMAHDANSAYLPESEH